MTIRTITGNINTLAGVDIPNATFSLVPETYVFGSTYSEVIFGELITVEADASGDVSFDLHEGKYVGRISTSQGARSFRLTVDSEGPWTLGRLIGELDAITSSLAAQVFDARDEAEASAGLSQAWAESPTPPDPNDATSKSSKTWAGEAAASAALADSEGNATIALNAAQSAEQDADRAEAARDITEAYAGVVSQATSVANLTDPTTLTIGDRGIVSGSGDDGIDGLYEVQDDSGNVWVRVGDTGLAGKLDRAETGTAAAAGKVPRASPFEAYLSPDWVAPSLGGMQSVLAETPDLVHFDRIADFTRRAYAQRVNGVLQVQGYDDVVRCRQPEPVDGAGLSTDPDDRKNRCIAAINEPDGVSIASSSGQPLAVVDVADLPPGPREYFSGLELGGQPVRRVYRVNSSAGPEVIVRPFMDTLSGTVDHTVSAYVFAMNGGVRISLHNQAPYSDPATVGVGERITTTATAAALGNDLRLRLTDFADVYFTGLQCESGTSATTYELGRSAFSLISFRQPIAGAGTLLMGVKLPAAEASGEIDMARSVDVLPASLRIFWNWLNGSIRAQVTSTAASSNNASMLGPYAPGQEILIAARYETDGAVSVSINGNTVALAAVNLGHDLSAIADIYFGAAEHSASTLPFPRAFSEIEITRLAWKSEA